MLQSAIVGNGNMLKLVYDLVDRKGLMIRILRKRNELVLLSTVALHINACVIQLLRSSQING